jgi:hypothetical protein
MNLGGKKLKIKLHNSERSVGLGCFHNQKIVFNTVKWYSRLRALKNENRQFFLETWTSSRNCCWRHKWQGMWSAFHCIVWNQNLETVLLSILKFYLRNKFTALDTQPDFPHHPALPTIIKEIPFLYLKLKTLIIVQQHYDYNRSLCDFKATVL